MTGNRLTSGKGGGGSWAGGTDQARDQIYEHCTVLNAKPWVKASGIEYYVKGESPNLSIDSRSTIRPVDRVQVTAAEARQIVKHNPSSWGKAMVEALERGEKKRAVSGARARG